LSESLRSGYPSVIFMKNGKKQHKRVHRILAEVFIPNPLNLPCVNHIDGDRTNYSLSNLEWVTQKQNRERRAPNPDSKFTLKKYPRIKNPLWKPKYKYQKKGNKKLKDPQVTDLEKMFLEGTPKKVIARKFNISPASVRRYLNRLGLYPS
jgi:hypothetical protein